MYIFGRRLAFEYHLEDVDQCGVLIELQQI